MIIYYLLPDDFQVMGSDLIEAPEVDTGHWQSLKEVPQTKTRELTNVVVLYEIPEILGMMVQDLKPNLPWAEDHFQERVGGKPLNPGEQYKNWPWYRGNVEAHQSGLLQFSHTYMERFWPKHAAPMWNEAGCQTDEAYGIRYNYGDLNDVVKLLAREPYTRQAILPVFFPEDTGAHHGGRIPCSLYYHFMIRDGRLDVNYTIRSCDFLRHFRDDVYMAARLCQWVLAELQSRVFFKTVGEYPDDRPVQLLNLFDQVTAGKLTMLMHSLHIFEGDLPKMRREYG